MINTSNRFTSDIEAINVYAKWHGNKERAEHSKHDQSSRQVGHQNNGAALRHLQESHCFKTKAITAPMPSSALSSGDVRKRLEREPLASRYTVAKSLSTLINQAIVFQKARNEKVLTRHLEAERKGYGNIHDNLWALAKMLIRDNKTPQSMESLKGIQDATKLILDPTSTSKKLADPPLPRIREQPSIKLSLGQKLSLQKIKENSSSNQGSKEGSTGSSLKHFFSQGLAAHSKSKYQTPTEVKEKFFLEECEDLSDQHSIVTYKETCFNREEDYEILEQDEPFSNQRSTRITFNGSFKQRPEATGMSLIAFLDRGHALRGR